MKATTFVIPTGRLVRCPGCGGMVQMPCVSCYVAYGQYPDDVMELCRHPQPYSTLRRCRKCQKMKQISEFGKESSVESNNRIVYSICIECRTNEQRARARVPQR